MKYSKQRELVLNAVRQNYCHPTADFVYTYLRREHPNISLGTVYRNLNLLAECGLIHRVGMPGGSDRYDARMDEHYHMVCEKCGCVFDVELELLDGLDRRIEEDTGFCVKSHNLIISGICSCCRHDEIPE